MSFLAVAPRVSYSASDVADAGAVARLEDIDVRVGGVAVLRRLSLALGTGEVVALTGANGSGKSTLLRVLATLLRPQSGTGHVFGATLAEAARSGVRRRIALVGHGAALHPELTLSEHLDLVAHLSGAATGRSALVLERVGLGAAATRIARRCSAGMLRRAELARVLLTEPHLLLLDEAHAALDPQARELVAAVVAGVARRGGSAVLVTHDLDAVAAICDRHVRLHDGRLHEAGCS